MNPSKSTLKTIMIASLVALAMALGSYQSTGHKKIGWIPVAHAETATDAPSAEELQTAEATAKANIAACDGDAECHAQTTKSYFDESGEGTTKQQTELIENIGKLSQYVNNIFNPLTYFFTFKIGVMLGNDYIYGGAMGEMLNKLWVVNRNIVNVLFVLILLAMALKYIFTPSEDAGGLVKKLPMFALFLIAVNFSWLGTKLVLDAGNVAANIVFALPSGVKGAIGSTDLGAQIDNAACTVNGDTGWKPKGSCAFDAGYNLMGATTIVNYPETSCTEDKKKEFEKQYEEALKNPTSDGSKERLKIGRICWKTIKFEDFKQNNASAHLTYGMAKIQNLTRATFAPGEGGPGLIKMAMSTLFALILQIIYLIAFMALFIVLVVRVVMLWIIVGFSPYIVLVAASKETKVGEKMVGAIEKYVGVGPLVNWAFAPAKLGAVWSVGFIMITIGQLPGSKMDALLGATGQIEKILFGGTTSLFQGLESPQQLIWFIITAGLVWVGTFAMASDLEIAKGVLNTIKSGTEGIVGGGAKMVASRVPIVPIYDDKIKGYKRVSIGELIKGTKELARPRDWDGNPVATGNEAAVNRLDKARVEAIVREAGKITDGSDKEVMEQLGKVGFNIEELKSMDEEKINALLKKAIEKDSDRKLVVDVIIRQKGGGGIVGAKAKEETEKGEEKVQKPDVKPATDKPGTASAHQPGAKEEKKSK